MTYLAITTQDVENYGTASEPFWKMKGGDIIYVSAEDFSKGQDLLNLITQENEAFKTYVLDIKTVDAIGELNSDWEGVEAYEWDDSGLTPKWIHTYTMHIGYGTGNFLKKRWEKNRDTGEVMSYTEEKIYIEPKHDDYEDSMTDMEADADALASAGWGTDEDYGA